MAGPVLRIGVDAREIIGDATGVGRYLAELLQRWTARPDADLRKFILFAPDGAVAPASRGARGRAHSARRARRHLVGADAPCAARHAASRSTCSSPPPTPPRSACRCRWR